MSLPLSEVPEAVAVSEVSVVSETVASESVLTETVAPTDKPYLTIRPGRGWAALDLAQLWKFRDLLFTLAERDVRLRYKQTALGVLWVVFQPMLGAGLLSFVFNFIAKVPTGTTPPFVFSYIGMLAFNAFNNTLGKASTSLVSNAALISKVFFPRLMLPLSTAFSTLIDFFVGLGMLGVLMVIYRIAPSWAIVTLPFWLALILMLALGVGLIASALMVSYRDVQYVLPVLVSFLNYACPIAYPTAFLLERLPAAWHPWYFVLNPFAGLIEAFRWSITGGEGVPWNAVVYSSCLAVVAFVLGAFAFKKMERKFADVI